MRDVFLRELGQGYAAAAAARDSLRAHFAREPLETLRHFFHNLAGAAPMAGEPLLGKLAGACEAAISAMLAGKFAECRFALQLVDDGLAGVAVVLGA